MNLLAFAFHIVCGIFDDRRRQAGEKLSPGTRFFETLRSLTVYLLFPSGQDPLATGAFERSPPRQP